MIVSPSEYDDLSVVTTIEPCICPNAGAMPILTIKIADRANTVKCDFIIFRRKYVLFKVVKKFVDKIEKRLVFDEFEITYILTRA